MKKIICLISLLFIFFFVSNSQAIYLKGKWALTTGSGITLPIGRFHNTYRQGFWGEIELENFYSSKSSSGINIGYKTFKSSDKTSHPYEYENCRILSLGAFIRHNIPSEGKLIPYITVSLKFNNFKGYDDDAKYLGIGLGYGLRFLAGEKFLLGAEGMIHSVHVRFDSDPPLYVTISGRLSYLFGGD